MLDDQMKDKESTRNAILNFREGQIIAGKYRLISLEPSIGGGVVKDIGRGGTGVVYKAEQMLHGDQSVPRAIKFYVLRDDIAELTAHKDTAPVSTSNFLDEIRNLSNVNHQNILKVIEAGFWPSQHFGEVPFVVTAYANGPTLGKGIEDGTLSELYRSEPHHIHDLILQLCSAVRYLHARRFYHCDIAPKNIFLENSGRDCALILGDLGIGRTISDDDLNSDEEIFLTGTKDYSPEDVRSCINTRIPLRRFCSFQPRWDLYAIAKTAIDLIRAVVNPNHLPGYLKAVIKTLENVQGGQGPSSIDDLTERIRILHPTQHTIWEVPELSENSPGTKRWLSPVDSVPVSKRIKPIANHPVLRRLKSVPQLVMASRLFSAGNHDRYEHSLGVYQTMREYMVTLLSDENFLCFFTPRDVELALVASLLSNITRFPFSTIIHEVHSADPSLFSSFSREQILGKLFSMQDYDKKTIPVIISEVFPQVNIDELTDILTTSHLQHERSAVRFIKKLLNSSVDVRVLDYVRRDAHHMGTAKGDVFEFREFLRHVCVRNDELMIRSTGLSHVEQIVANRFWLFNRMYWNRPNRTMIAMLRLVFLKLHDVAGFTDRLLERVINCSEEQCLEFLYLEANAAGLNSVASICSYLIGMPRLYQELVGYTRAELDANDRVLCDRIQHVPPKQLESFRAELNEAFQNKYKLLKDTEHILIDMPVEYGPMKLGEDINVLTPQDVPVSLTKISGIVQGVQAGFTDHIQRLRVLVHPDSFKDIFENKDEVVQFVKNKLLRF